MADVQQIRHFILRHVAANPKHIAAITAKQFELSRQAVNKHLRDLTAGGQIVARGRTKGRAYELAVRTSLIEVSLEPSPEEDRIWREWVVPQIENVQDNVRRICQYGFTEMVNNAIDHSQGTKLFLTLARSAASIDLKIIDNGVGIFRKIRDAFGLEDEQHAGLELSKGKLTTDPTRHTGEGIFFTSRMFDKYSILSGSLFLLHMLDDSDWLVEHTAPSRLGTALQLAIDPDSERTIKSVFDRFSDVAGDYGFDVTHVPVALAQHGAENLVSRSQAKRLLARLDLFKTVVLNFEGVEQIGPAFADEVFRVFQADHPDIQLVHVNAVEEVDKMIRRALPGPNTEPIPLL